MRPYSPRRNVARSTPDPRGRTTSATPLELTAGASAAVDSLRRRVRILVSLSARERCHRGLRFMSETPTAPWFRPRAAVANRRCESAAWAPRCSPQRATIEVAGVHFCFVPIRIKDEQRPAFEWLLALDRPTRPILRGGKRLDDFVEGVLSDGKGKVHRPA